ncbi:hypothetical protein J6590_041664 [Homalodisca vitripennis]|nr:hypothetical protein J6590_041664 [Homalodisca vitripennis]
MKATAYHIKAGGVRPSVVTRRELVGTCVGTCRTQLSCQRELWAVDRSDLQHPNDRPTSHRRRYQLPVIYARIRRQ